jgi:hypoxanthine phosphoribosyltransferase
MERLHLSWEGLLALARRLAEALREEFDLILGIARGGLIPTALLQALSVRDILTAAVMFHGGEETLPEPVFLQFPPDPLLFGKRGGRPLGLGAHRLGGGGVGESLKARAKGPEPDPGL